MAVKSLAQSSLVDPFSTNSMLAGYSGNAFHHLETVRLGGLASSVSFSNLAQYSDFQHLQVRMATRTDRSGDGDFLMIRFNGVSTSSYSRHQLYGNGSSVLSFALANTNYMASPDIASSGSSSGIFGAMTLDIIDPFETSKNTTVKIIGGAVSGFKQIGLFSNAYYSTDSISSITFFSGNSANIVAGSRFSLYGFKARA